MDSVPNSSELQLHPVIALTQFWSTIKQRALPPAGDLVPSFVREWRPVCDETENWEIAIERA